MKTRMLFRSLWLALLSLWLFSCPPSFADNTRYDDDIRASVRKYWAGGPDWLMWKAQLIQESRLDPNAVSPVGARGLAQFMPATWNDMVKQLGIPGASPHDAKYAITAGAYYMAQQRRFPDWKNWADPDRHRMAQAAYNAGAGNIRKALRRCAAVTHAGMESCLPQITGKHSKETITYVARIQKLYDSLSISNRQRVVKEAVVAPAPVPVEKPVVKEAVVSPATPPAPAEKLSFVQRLINAWRNF